MPTTRATSQTDGTDVEVRLNAISDEVCRGINMLWAWKPLNSTIYDSNGNPKGDLCVWLA